ncbi:MAG: hypothetical protein E6L03_09955 [Thaumarchaeota archaeon]|nr:MAG: hypothetical protein E6L03_09955 [Nitrososphaerota archaeon]
MTEDSSRVSPANEFITLANDLYTNPHRNIALINAGIQHASLGWHLLLNKYMIMITKAKTMYQDPDTKEFKIKLDFAKLTEWELKALVQHAQLIDELATRVMSMSPQAHHAHADLIKGFNLGNFSTSINQIPGMDNLSGDEAPKRKSREPSVVEDFV